METLGVRRSYQGAKYSVCKIRTDQQIFFPSFFISRPIIYVLWKCPSSVYSIASQVFEYFYWSNSICRQQNPLCPHFLNQGISTTLSKIWIVLRESIARLLFPIYTFLKLIFLSLGCHAGYSTLPSLSKLTFNYFSRGSFNIASMYRALTQDLKISRASIKGTILFIY